MDIVESDVFQRKNIISEDRPGKKVRKGSTLALKPRAEVQNKGISGPTKRTCILQQFLKNKEQNNIIVMNKKSCLSSVLIGSKEINCQQLP